MFCPIFRAIILAALFAPFLHAENAPRLAASNLNAQAQLTADTSRFDYQVRRRALDFSLAL